jgi:hypothetical protein
MDCNDLATHDGADKVFRIDESTHELMSNLCLASEQRVEGYM